MPAKTHPRVLLVEGDEDKRVIPQLIEANGVPWGERDQPKIVHIEAYGGLDAMLEPGEIDTQLKASGLQALGIGSRGCTLFDASEARRRDPVRGGDVIRRRCLAPRARVVA